MLSLMRIQFRNAHNSLKLSFSMKSVFHPGFLIITSYFLGFFSLLQRHIRNRINHQKKLMVFRQKPK